MGVPIEMVSAGPVSDLAKKLGLDEDDPEVPNLFARPDVQLHVDEEEYYKTLKPAEEGGYDLANALAGFAEEVGLLAPRPGAREDDSEVAEGQGSKRGFTDEQTVDDIAIDDMAFVLSLLPRERIVPSLKGLPLLKEAAIAPVPRLLPLLADLALKPSLTFPIAKHFWRLMPEIMARWLAFVGIDVDGTYPEEYYDLWPEALPLEARLVHQEGAQGALDEEDAEMQDVNKDASETSARADIAGRVSKVFAAFGVVAGLHAGSFPFLILLMCHPALSRDPMTLLPHDTTTGLDNLDGRPSDEHPIFTSPLVVPHLQSLLRLLSALPHLPFPGLVPGGWTQPPSLQALARFHPRQGVRLLAWRCWRCWLTHDGLAALAERKKHEWVWRPPPVEGGVRPQECPFPSWIDDSGQLAADAAAEIAQGKLPEEFVFWREESVGSWKIVSIGGGQALARQVRRRFADAWILEQLEDQTKTEQLRALGALQPYLPSYMQSSPSTPSHPLAIQRHDFSPIVVDIEGNLALRDFCLPRSSVPSSLNASTTPTRARQQPAHPESQGGKGEAMILAAGSSSERYTRFVNIPSSVTSLRALAAHVTLRTPVLLSGPPSSGKTTLIEHLAQRLHAPSAGNKTEASQSSRSCVTLNLAARTLDAKSILGSWASDPRDPGKFVFVEGPIVRAMKDGRWLVCEDLDKGSEDVLAVVNSIADNMRLRSCQEAGGAFGGHGGGQGVGIDLGSQGGWVQAAPGFALLATRSIRSGSDGATFMGQQYWSTVKLSAPQADEIQSIVLGICPRLTDVAVTLIEAWTAMVEQSDKWEGKVGSSRPLGLRDLLRWVRRTEALLSHVAMFSSLASNPVIQDEVFLEGVDVFLASLPSLEDTASELLAAGRVLGAFLGLSSERVEYCLNRRVPDFVVPSTSSAQPNIPSLVIGRVRLPASTQPHGTQRHFALTKPSRCLLEQLAAAVRSGESPLLVGETGTGKTAVTGFLATCLGKKLVALNLSNQSEASDLLGGFKPINAAYEARIASSSLLEEFTRLFGEAFDVTRNSEFLLAARKAQAKRRWSRLVAMFREAARLLSARKKGGAPIAPGASDGMDPNPPPSKRRRLAKSPLPSHLHPQWHRFLTDVSDFEDRHVRPATGARVRFAFVEGPLVNALRNGDWVLLDEINLASPETLEALSNLLHNPGSSVVLSERGDVESIPRHPDFRLFACMNPATDVGKRDLPSDLRSRFSEVYVPPPDANREALLTIVSGYLNAVAVGDKRVVTDVTDFYLSARYLAKAGQIGDGTNAPPHYSMRTLARALVFALDVAPSLGLRRALVEGLTMAFVTALSHVSADVLRALIATHIVEPARNPRAVLSQQPKPPPGGDFVRVGAFHLPKGTSPTIVSDTYVVTESVQTKLVDLARAVTTSRYPVLIQGPTSSGKTSIIEHLASLTAHQFVRINNHEHTDIQEYIGSYVADPDSGNLVFREGILVHAMRHGEWIVLDELNLAPSDVLEALNRLLDDNRELFVSETQEVIRPHPHFMLFATQNPPGVYGGRKVLSRAFRNRFLELQFDDVPQDELELILCHRCRIAPSYASKIVAVFLELQRRRQANRVFEQRHSFVTLRDLFRWGAREAVGYQKLAEDGFILIGERARLPEERDTVKTVIETVMKVKIDVPSLYARVELPSTLVPTAAARRLFTLVAEALAHDEPVLLVGEPGSGKTSVVEVIGAARMQLVKTVNLHQNTEVADLLGSQRPVRNRAEHARSAVTALPPHLRLELGLTDNTAPQYALNAIRRRLAAVPSTDGSRTALEVAQKRLEGVASLFMWSDGPIVQAMRDGHIALLDEISLADDSVLERLNSLLEPARSLTLAERGTEDLESLRLVADSRFQLVATMNPGGDFGKKELSPALRNRFTEIWVPLIDDAGDREAIYAARLSSKSLEQWARQIVSFSSFFCLCVSRHLPMPDVSLRDGLAWCDFMCASSLASKAAFVHGARLSLLDRLGTTGFGQALSPQQLSGIRAQCVDELYKLGGAGGCEDADVTFAGDSLRIGPFQLHSRSPTSSSASTSFRLATPTTARNAMRVLRALDVPKSVLLEGSPGVGKTSIITALARIAGQPLYRINLSDQTDLLDLFGSDVPVEGGSPGEYIWRDATFLHALKTGGWVLLDEMNLAPQPVLEGLNACLDYRGSAYIPELDKTFTKHPTFRVFAAQNPHHQGGARKGLPRSLVDRFTVVFMDELTETDLNDICSALAPSVPSATLSAMVRVNSRLDEAVNRRGAFATTGAPWEFNLRDLTRWLTTIEATDSGGDLVVSAFEHFDLVYGGRFRTVDDKRHSRRIFDREFPELESASKQIVVPGFALLPELRSQAQRLALCLRFGWLPILAGPPSSGKTSLARHMAGQDGRALRSIVLSSASDTSDLLGGFEQRRPQTSLRTFANDLKRFVSSRLASLERPAGFHRALDIWQTLEASAFDEMSRQTGECLLADMLDAFEEILPAPDATSLASFRIRLQAYKSRSEEAAFEWVDGPLVAAMKAGDWILLENANCCSASVLDRLNPLFEGTSAFVLSERGMLGGEVPVMTPLASFRVLLSFDPRCGELSRAMRNRGIEIYFPHRDSTERPDLQPTTRSLAVPRPNRFPAPFDLPLSARATAESTSAVMLAASWTLAGISTYSRHLSFASRAEAWLQAGLKALDEGQTRLSLEVIRGAIRSRYHADAEILDPALEISACDPRVGAPAEADLRTLPVLVETALLVGRLNAPIQHLDMPEGPIRSVLVETCRLVQGLAASLLQDLKGQDASPSAKISTYLQSLQMLMVQLWSSPSDPAMVDFIARTLLQSLDRIPQDLAPQSARARAATLALRREFVAQDGANYVRTWTLLCNRMVVPPTLLQPFGSLLQAAQAAWSAASSDLRRTFLDFVSDITSLAGSNQLHFARIAPLTSRLSQEFERRLSTETTARPLEAEVREFEAVALATGCLRACTEDVLLAFVNDDVVVSRASRPTLAIALRQFSQSSTGGVHHEASGNRFGLQVETALQLTIANVAEGHVAATSLFEELAGAKLLGLTTILTSELASHESLQASDEVRAQVSICTKRLSSALVGEFSSRKRRLASLHQDLLQQLEIPELRPNESRPSFVLEEKGVDQPFADDAYWATAGDRAMNVWRSLISEYTTDPLAAVTAEQRFHRWQWARCRSTLADIRSWEAAMHYEPTCRAAQVGAEINKIEHTVDVLPRPPIPRRPAPHRFLGLYREIQAFNTRFMSPERIRAFLVDDATSHASSENFAQRHNWIVAAQSLFQRLRAVYADIADVLDPFELAFQLVRVATAMASKRQSEDAREFASAIGRLLMPASSIAAHQMAFIPNPRHLDPVSERELILLRLSASLALPPARRTTPLIGNVLRLYDRLWRFWSLDQKRREEREREREQLFKVRDAAAPGVGEEEAAALAALFPSTDDEVSGVSTDIDLNASAVVRPADMSYLNVLHRGLFDPSGISLKAFMQFDEKRLDTIAKVWGGSEALSDDIDRVAGLTLLCRMARLRETPAPSGPLDFYRDTNEAEAQRLRHLLVALEQDVAKVLSIWPDLPALEDLAGRCVNIRHLPRTIPLAQLIPRVESIVASIEDWQKLADREHTLGPHQGSLTALVVSWRRLELASWSTILEREMAAFHASTDEWWFRIYELVVRGVSAFADVPSPRDPEDLDLLLRECVQALGKFIENASVGQFATRLQLIRSFAALVAELSPAPVWSRVHHVLVGVAFYYGRFEGEVSERINLAKRAAQTAVSDCIRLASWKDVNIVALRQSSQRSHHALYKIVRRFRAALQEPAKPTRDVRTEESEPHNFASIDLPPLVYRQPAAELVIPTGVLRATAGLAVTAPSHLKSAHETLRRLDATVSEVLAQRQREPSPSVVAELATEIRQTAAALNKSTIGEGAAAEKRARNLDMRKRKAFSDLLRELKRLGLSPSATARTVEKNTDLLATMGRRLLPNLDEVGSASERRLTALLDSMTRFRQLGMSRHEDLTSTDAQRATGSVENGVATIIRDQQTLAAAFSDYEKMFSLHGRLQALFSVANVRQVGDWPAEAQKSQTAVASGLAEVRDKCRDLNARNLLDIPAALLAQLEELLQEARMEETELATIVQHTSGTLTAATQGEWEVVARVSQRVASVHGRIARIAVDLPQVAFIFSPFYLQLEPFAQAVQGNSTTTVALSQAHDDLWLSHAKVLDSILLVVQRLLAEAKDHASNYSDADKGLAKGALRAEHATCVSRTNGCHTSDILAALQSFCKAFAAAPTSDSMEIDSFNIILGQRVYAFLTHYLRLLYAHLTRHLQWQQSVVDLLSTVTGIVILVGEKGFCKPRSGDADEPSEAGNEKTTEGTGLGEGSGGKDVSDQVQDDAQLEGLEGEAELAEDRQQRGQDEPDSAIDTKMDFDGDVEDVEDEQREDGEGSDDEEVDVEDAVGSVDPLDANAVDEKMWQEPPDDQDNDQAESEVKQQITHPEQSSEMSAREEDREQPASKEGESINGEDQSDQLSADEDGAEDRGDQDGPGPLEDGQLDTNNADEGSRLDLPEDMTLDEERKAQSDASDEELDDDISEPAEEVDSIGDETGHEQQMREDTASPTEADRGHAQGNEEGAQDAEAAAIEAAPGGGGGVDAHAMPTGRGISDGSTRQARQEMVESNAQMPDEGAKAPEHSSGGSNARTEPAPIDIAMAEGQQPDARMEAGSSGPEGLPPAEALLSDSRRDLGSNLERWRKRLMALGDLEEDQSAESAGSDRKDPNDPAAGQFTGQDEQPSGDEQAAGPATIEQAQASQRLPFDDDDVLPMEELQRAAHPQAPLESHATPMDFDMPNHGSEGCDVDKAVQGQRKVGPVDIELSEPLASRAIAEDETQATDADREGPVDVTQIEEKLRTLQPSMHATDAAEVWRIYENAIQSQAFRLAEQLRLVLEPTAATRLQGDYRTGKRLNMRKLIPYIASDFTKDKIWLRRTRPAQRDYQIMLAIDDSRSMADSRSAHLAFQTLALFTRGLSLLEVGDVSIVRFGHSVDIVRPFGQGVAFDAKAGSSLVEQFSFSQQSTDVRLLIERTLQQFGAARATAKSSAAELWQLGVIVSDGVCQDHEALRALLRRALERRVLFVFVVLDSLHQRHREDEHDSSIVDMTSVNYTQDSAGRMQMQMQRYLDTFPFEYYIILRDVAALPDVLSSTLRQFFEKVSSS